MENVGDQHQIESLRQGMRQNIEGKHLDSFCHACVLDARYGQKERPLDALPRSLEGAETADSRQEQNSQARHQRRERLNGSRFMR